MNESTWDAIVIGGATAGLSAAQALGRSRRRTLVIDAGSPRNRFAPHMHNVLGHDGIDPMALIEKGRAEAAVYGVEFMSGQVAAVADSATESTSAAAGTTLDVVLEDGTALTTRAVVVATGHTDVLPDITGINDYWGTSVAQCPYCHGWEVRDSRIGVIVTSPAGAHHAKMLRQWTDRLTVFSAGLGELEAQFETELLSRRITIVPSAVTEVVGDGNTMSSVRTADGASHDIDAIFTMGSTEPHDGFLADLNLDRSDSPWGSVLALDSMGRTSHPKIWAAGNVANPAATVPLSMSMGAFAGAAVNHTLIEEDFAAAVAASQPSTQQNGA